MIGCRSYRGANLPDYDNLEFTVVTVEPPRLLQIRLHRLEESVNEIIEDKISDCQNDEE